MSRDRAESGMRLQRSSRDTGTLIPRLTEWLATRLPADAAPNITLRSGIDSNGMSAETLVLDMTWTEAGIAQRAELIARMAPAPGDFPILEHYNLRDQFDTMRIVAESSGVPVPRVRFIESTGDVLGTPFLLMDRIDGLVPPDVMPYTFGDNWLFDASAEQQKRLQHSTIETLARLHAIPDAATVFAFLDPRQSGANSLERTLERARSWYEFAARDSGSSPLAERILHWLTANLPASPGETVLSWGDARIGNCMYRDFTPVAVLDWELATIGPRELDLAWLIFGHRVFQTIADTYGLPGMPDFLREEDVTAAYTEYSGVRIGELTWYTLFAALNYCVVFMRSGGRQVHFGEMERPDNIELVFHHKPLVEQLLAEIGA
ncbi:phosphotransferase family protein [Nocardia pseudobrasiliensis]|uniref:Aminoglycoside phosphotransferase (APT) family kinase protein n=1 Tax=Nocardia pseudobrasiliensis TaxID=45979 RepID=A0A370HXX2_9NOCA|nr:phosphotransferase family protein [Nocardia pseudobrasiliensis]RDI63352.1 aminoglycoside phosphotransferase (APT) family kinase protein [Nocardia pseudobrasiliensis]